MRQRADARALFGGDARRRECLNHALGIEDAEGRVFGTRDGARLVDDALQDLVAVELRRQGETGGVQRGELLAPLLKRLRRYPQLLRALPLALLDARELPEDRRREAEDAREPDDQRDEVRGSRRE